MIPLRDSGFSPVALRRCGLQNLTILDKSKIRENRDEAEPAHFSVGKRNFGNDRKVI